MVEAEEPDRKLSNISFKDPSLRFGTHSRHVQPHVNVLTFVMRGPMRWKIVGGMPVSDSDSDSLPPSWPQWSVHYAYDVVPSARSTPCNSDRSALSVLFTDRGVRGMI